jgi:hypothetical protein
MLDLRSGLAARSGRLSERESDRASKSRAANDDRRALPAGRLDVERRVGGLVVARAQRPRLAIATEDQIQRAVADYLRLRGVPGLLWWHTPNGELRRPGAGGRLKAYGARAGMPDLMMILGGRTYALEIKTEHGRVSAAQRAVHADLKEAGAEVWVAFGLDAAIGQLKKWGVVR